MCGDKAYKGESGSEEDKCHWVTMCLRGLDCLLNISRRLSSIWVWSSGKMTGWNIQICYQTNGDRSRRLIHTTKQGERARWEEWTH